MYVNNMIIPLMKKMFILIQNRKYLYFNDIDKALKIYHEAFTQNICPLGKFNIIVKNVCS